MNDFDLDRLAQVWQQPLLSGEIAALEKGALLARRRAKAAQWLETILAHHPPPAVAGRRLKIKYITQAKTRPPGFVLFGTRLDQLPESYRRYLLNGLRNELGFTGVPIRLTLRSARNPYARD